MNKIEVVTPMTLSLFHSTILLGVISPWSMRYFVFICASLSFVVSSYARVNIAPSIEWLADQSSSVGVYSVVAIRIENAPQAHDPSKQQWGRWGSAAVELELTEKKKGSPPAKFKSIYMLHPAGSDADIRREITKGHQILCFLSAASRSPDLELRYSVNLDSPTSYGPHTPISSAFTVLHSKDEVVFILDARLKHPGAVHRADERKFWVEAPWDSPAFGALYGGSTCYLVVPEDLRPK